MAANVDTPAPELALVALLPLGGVALPAALTRALEAYRHAVAIKPSAEELLSASLAVMAGRATLLADAVTAVRSAADPRGSLIPVMALLAEETGAGGPWLDPAWRTAADIVLPLEATVAEIAAALEKLHRVSAAAAQLPADDIGATTAEKRRIRALRWLATRQIEWLGPTRSPSAPLLHRYGALDAICGAHLALDLEAMAKAKLLETEHADRVYCCPCGDARLFFRDACEFCHSTDLGVAHTLRHKACGKVAPSADFWLGEELVCPGCQTPLKQAGVDYDGPFDHTRCGGCGKYAAKGSTLATCLGCGISTDAEKLAVRPLHRYRLTEQGRIAALAVPGAAVAGDAERRSGLLANWRKLAGGKAPAALVRYTAASVSGGALDSLIAAALRGKDCAVRLGGNSFLALLAETGADGAKRFVERMAEAEKKLHGAGVLPLPPATVVLLHPEQTAEIEAAVKALEV